jgi:hypothetical protein
MSSKKLDCAVELVHLIYAYLTNINDDLLDSFIANWPSEPFVTRTISSNSLPVLGSLPNIVADNNLATQKIIDKLRVAAEQLDWQQSYTAEEIGDDFLANYGWTELIGLRGPVKSKNISCGFLMLGPNIEYPKHCHEACEVYIPLTSQTAWVAGESGMHTKVAGNIIYHDSWLAHAMRTNNSPLLALYFWHGGKLSQKPRIG